MKSLSKRNNQKLYVINVALLVSLNRSIQIAKEKNRKTSGNFSSIILQSASTSTPIATFRVSINGVMGAACVDTAAMHSITGETLYYILKKEGIIFTPSSLMMIAKPKEKFKLPE